jgi:hypothetical protein
MRAGILCLAALCGCNAFGDGELSASASCRADNVVVADVRLALTNVAAARVRHDRDVHEVVIPADGVYSVPMLGMTAGAANLLRVEVDTRDGATVDLGELSVDCAPLPDGLPRFGAITGGAPEGGYLLVSALDRKTMASVAAAIDHGGRLYWYHQTRALGEFKQTPDGDLAFFEAGAFVRERLDGSRGRLLGSPMDSRGADNHELLVFPDQSALLLGLNQRDTLLESTIVGLDGDGNASFYWSGADHVAADETTADIDVNVPPVDVHHANALDLLADGNILLSLRHTDTLYKIDRTSGDILWRLGGARSDFSFAADPTAGFSHQHFARQLEGGDLLLLDNGNLHSPPASRVAQYRLDEAAHTATLVWEHRHRKALYTNCCGSTVRLPTGNTLTAWGTTGIIEEVDPSGALLWEMTVPDSIVYRAQPVASLY